MTQQVFLTVSLDGAVSCASSLPGLRMLPFLLWRRDCEMKMRSLIFLLAVCTLHAASLRCPSLRILTSGSTFSSLPPLVSQVTSTSSFSSYPIDELFFFSFPSGTIYSWCSGNTDSPNVTITIKEPVLVYGLLSGGYFSGGAYSHVTRFKISYPGPEGGNSSSLNPISVFNVFQMGSPALFPNPLLLTTLNLHVVDHISSGFNRLCWTVALFGCLQSNAVNDTEEQSVASSISMQVPFTSTAASSTSRTPAASSSPPAAMSPSPTPGVAEGPCLSMAQTQENNSQRAVIGLSIALVVMAMVNVATLTVLAVSWRTKYGALNVTRSTNDYSMDIIPRQRSETIRDVQNELYEASLPKEQVYEDVHPYSGTRGGGGGGSGGSGEDSGSGGGDGIKDELIENPAYHSEKKPPNMAASSDQWEYSYVAISTDTTSARAQPE